MPEKNPNDPNQLEGFDPSQRAEILEAEGENPKGEDDAIVNELKPDRGQSINDRRAAEEEISTQDAER